MVGNDIVDLHNFGSPAWQHVGHLERVCTPGEARRIRNSPDPCKTLAAVWASKEAAYKLVSKQFLNCRFVPRNFVTQFEDEVLLSSDAELVVTYAELRANVQIALTERWVHAVATFSETTVVHWAVREIEKCIPHGELARAESEAVRYLATDLLSTCGKRGLTLRFSGRIPRLSGDEMDISLSHHGAFAGAAIAWHMKKDSLNKEDCFPSAGALFSEGTCSTCTA